VISYMSFSDRWWWWPAGSPQGQRPVLFFPPAGADQTVVSPLVHHLAGVRFAALRMPGRGLRRGEPPPSTMAEAVEAIASSIAAMAGPAPLLVGHSLGGLVAFAVAQKLEHRGRAPARLMALTSTAPHAWEQHLTSSGAQDSQDYVERRVARLLRDGAVPTELAEHPELGTAVREALTDDVRMSYTTLDGSPLSCAITSVVARDDAIVDREATALWHKATSRELEEIVVPGDHFFYRTNPQLLSRLIVGELTALDGAYQFD
jgi:surfactin synthase thioesterase subunit